jgi:capsule polysaccharide export protein KpsE/RkpR
MDEAQRSRLRDDEEIHLLDYWRVIRQRAQLIKEGLISIQVEAVDPQPAADIANFYVDSLDRMVTRLEISEASRQRAFISERVAQIEVMHNFATEANPEVVKLKRRIEEMKRHLGQLQYGQGWTLPAANGTHGEPYKAMHVAFPQLPELGLELARLTRDVKVQESVYTLLTQQLEQAKIAEARDMPVVRPLDAAVPADRHAKPEITLNLAMAAITSLSLGIFLAFVLGYLAGLKQAPPAHA